MKTIPILRKHQNVARASTFLIMIALIAGMAGCTQPVQYNLTISTAEGGEVTSPGKGTFSYDERTVVPLVAFPHTGYRFVSWTGDVSTIDNVNAASTTITMDGDYEIAAGFEAISPIQYKLTITSTEGGSVTSPGEGTFTYNTDTVVSLVAEAEEGYKFLNWIGDIEMVANVTIASTTITLSGNCMVTAHFLPAGQLPRRDRAWVMDPIHDWAGGRGYCYRLWSGNKHYC